MKKYKHLSIDIESLGTKPGCIVLSIGAVAFDYDIGNGVCADAELNVRVSVIDSMICGLVADASTIAWWGTQSSEARDALEYGEPVSVSGAVDALAEYVRLHCTPDCRVWMKGPSFDGVLLQAMAEAVSGTLPWKYWQERCVRTICEGVDEPERRAGNVHHSAVDDALHQALWVTSALQTKGGK